MLCTLKTQRKLEWTLRPAIQVAIKRREAVLWGVDRGVRGLYGEAKMIVVAALVEVHSDPQMGQNGRGPVQDQPKKRSRLPTVIWAYPKWPSTLEHAISKSILIFMLKFERTGPGGHPNFTALALLSLEQQDARPG